MTARLLLIALSAGLHALAMPPWNATPLAWVALVPFLLAIRDLRPLGGALAGLVWGTAAIWGIGYWVPLAFAFYYQQPLWFGLAFALGASIVFAGSYSAGFAACACTRPFRGRGALRIALLAALWVTWELARARLLTGDPWLLLGYALGPQPLLVQAADVGGVYLLSFVVAFVNGALAECLVTLRASPTTALRTLLVAVAVVLGVAAYGAFQLVARLPETPRVPLIVVQGNSDPGTQWREELYGQGLEQYLRLTAEAAARTHPQLVVWPENAVTFFLAREPGYRAAIARTLQRSGAELILGAPHHEGGAGQAPRYFNSAFVLTADGRVTGRYDKTHLLPFAEYFPLRTIEFLRRRFERVRYFTHGDKTTLLPTRVGDIATVICFEGIFPDLVGGQMRGGATLLVNLSNDAWLGKGAGPEQHLAMVALRAVENRTWIVRATSTGISAVIDPFGRIRARTETFVPAVLAAEVVPLRVMTIYKWIGDAFAFGCLVVCVLAALRHRRTPGAG